MWSRFTSIFRSSQPSSKTQSIPDMEMTTSINNDDKIYENIINRLKKIGVEIPEDPKQNIFLSILNKIKDSKTTDFEKKRRLQLLLQKYNDSFSNTQLERILYHNNGIYTEPDVMLPNNDSRFSLETIKNYFDKPITDNESRLNLTTNDTPTEKTGGNYIDKMSSSLDRDFYDLKRKYITKYFGGFYNRRSQPPVDLHTSYGNTYKDIMKSAEDYSKKKSILRNIQTVYNGYDQDKRVIFDQKTSEVHPTFLDPENYSKSSDDISKLMEQYLSDGQEMKVPDMMTSALDIVSL